MKINIGGFHKWWGPYQICELLKYVGVSEDRQHKLGEWLAKTWVNTVCEWIESKRKRKVEIRIDKYDTWGMDSTLAMIILPMLKQLRETKHGAPGTMPAFGQTSDSAQCCFDFYQESDEAAWDAGHQQWVEILNEMIWTFEQLQPDYDWEEQYWITHPEIDWADYPEDEGETCIPVRWLVKGECDWEGREAHAKRIGAGLMLFGAYYQDLWD